MAASSKFSSLLEICQKLCKSTSCFLSLITASYFTVTTCDTVTLAVSVKMEQNGKMADDMRNILSALSYLLRNTTSQEKRHYEKKTMINGIQYLPVFHCILLVFAHFLLQ